MHRIDIKYNKFDRIIGRDYWIGLLDGFFYPNSDVARPAGAFLAGAFFLFCFTSYCPKWS